MTGTYFYKYQALGNDMVVIDPATCTLPLTLARIRLICDRHFGVGADGICYGPLADEPHPYTMRFFNPDGSEAEKSGNGLRTFARHLWDNEYTKNDRFTISIHHEMIQVTIADDAAHTIALSMGHLSFQSNDILITGPPREVIEEEIEIGEKWYRVTVASMGNPHCVLFTDDLTIVHTVGPIIETAPHFPWRANVQFARVIDKHTIQIEIWERGVGYTLASGTSASAAAGAAVKSGRCQSPVEVQMAGGITLVEIDENWQITLTGTVSAVYKGVFAPEFLAQLKAAA